MVKKRSRSVLGGGSGESSDGDFGGSGESSDGDFGGSGESSDGDFGGSTGNEPNNRGTDWTNMCNTVQVALYSSCDELVNNDGSLTSQGQHALGCIRNGALLGSWCRIAFRIWRPSFTWYDYRRINAS